MSDPGRPTMLTKELIDELCGYISNGCNNITAIQLSCISETSFYYWKSLGEKDIKSEVKSIYSEFTERIKKAAALCKQWHIKNIMEAGKDKKHWTASAWYLERVYPDEFGRKEQVKYSGSVTVNFDKEDEDLV